ncbi:MAG: histidine kinase N-terminal 7TM domain-containing protein [Bacteroidota bacterium]
MPVQLHPYAFLLFASALISAGVTFLALARRNTSVMRSLALNTAALTVWALCYGMVWLSTDLRAQVLWFQAMYFGVVLVPYSFLALVLDAARQGRWLTPLRLRLLMVEPVLIVLAVWSNASHRLFVTQFTSQVHDGLIFLEVARGPLYWLNVIYSYALLAASMIVLARAFVRGAPLFRTQLVAFILGAALPWAGNVASLFGLVPFPSLDLTPIIFGVSGAMFYSALFRQRGFHLLPMARSRLLEELSDGLLVLDSGFRIMDANPAAERLLEVKASAMVGQKSLHIFPELKPLQDRLGDCQDELHEELQGIVDPDRYYEIKLTPLRNSKSVSGYLVLFRDISERWQAAEQVRQANKELSARLREIESLHRKLRAQATRDPLTNLYNRRYLEEILEKELARAERRGSPVSVIMVDADKFKRINDLYGHKAGDQALQSLSRMILQHIRRSDIACRYGGEEFVIVMPNTDAEVAHGRAEEIRRDFLEHDIFGPGTAGHSSLSIGIASYPAAGLRGEEVLDAADQAMYAAKALGGNRIKVRKTPVRKEPPDAGAEAGGQPSQVSQVNT